MSDTGMECIITVTLYTGLSYLCEAQIREVAGKNTHMPMVEFLKQQVCGGVFGGIFGTNKFYMPSNKGFNNVQYLNGFYQISIAYKIHVSLNLNPRKRK